MPTKTDNILANLPFTYRVRDRLSALKAVAGAVGDDLQLGENALAEVMFAHWVDHADRGAARILDLAGIGTLYGIAPQRDSAGADLETVEEFRERLKRHIRTLLEGSCTVPGVIRIAAEALGVHVPPDAELDAWWKRNEPLLINKEPRGEDAAELIFGLSTVRSQGSDARPAEVRGTQDLTGGADLSAGSTLRLQVDGFGPLDIDVAAGAASAASVQPEHIVDRINEAFGQGVASVESGRLVLRSGVIGPAGSIEVEDHQEDAARTTLGLTNRRYRGQAAQPARIVGDTDLARGADLRNEPFLRVVVDGQKIREIDCRGPVPDDTTAEQAAAAINAAFGQDLASVEDDDGPRLAVRSPIEGAGSTVFLQDPAAQNAFQRLFGRASRFALGNDDLRAESKSRAHPQDGIDLRERSNIRVRVDASPAVTIDCAGDDPGATTLGEVVEKLNAAIGPDSAVTDGRTITLRSRTSGSAGQLVFETADEGDALEEIFGIGPRVFHGEPALGASLTGLTDLAAGADLRALHVILLQVDEHDPIEIDLRSHATDLEAVTLKELADSINAAVEPLTGEPIAFDDSRRLILTSPTTGAGSRIEVLPLELPQLRRFVTRAPILDEASTALFGFVGRDARGSEPTRARLTGQADLKFGVDLRANRYIRLSMDGRPFQDIDCAGPRPRATTIAEIVANLESAFETGDPAAPQALISHDNRRITIASRQVGSASRIVFEPTRALDALDRLLGVEPSEVRGADAGQVTFVSTVNLSAGIELSPDAALSIGVDGAPPTNIPLNGATQPVRKNLSQIVSAINMAVGPVATHDGKLITIRSSKRGAESRLEFHAGVSEDVTQAILGIDPPRHYQAADARRAAIVGRRDLSQGGDLKVDRFLRISVDGGTAKDVDCAEFVPDVVGQVQRVVQLDDIRRAINRVFEATIAEHDGTRLTLASTKAGSASRIAVHSYGGGDARHLIFGEIADATIGQPAAAAQVQGEVDLRTSVDLSERRKIRIGVDDAREREIDVAGEIPAVTQLDEIIDAINEAFPDIASKTEDDRLLLTSPTAGDASRVRLIERRHLEVIEHPPQPSSQEVAVRHGQELTLENQGAAIVPAKLTISTTKGVSGATFADADRELQVVIAASIGAGESAVAEADLSLPGDPVRVTISGDGEPRILKSGTDYRIETTAGQLLENPVEALELPRGASKWRYLECLDDRFDHCRFDSAHFAGGDCRRPAIFNLSRFDGALAAGPGGHDVLTVFGATGPGIDPGVILRVDWNNHRAGGFTLNLPAELRPRFGGRFNEARFGQSRTSPERYSGVVTEPHDDLNNLSDRINAAHTGPRLTDDNPPPPGSSSRLSLVEADDNVAVVPIGFKAHTMPFRDPAFLGNGDERTPAQLFLTEDGFNGFIKLTARAPGTWGNRIGVTARPDGPGRYEVDIFFDGDRFESARAIVAGNQPPPLAAEALQPQPLGVLQVKAAGVAASVTRDRAASS